MSSDTQMTHFPALAPSGDDAKKSESGGIMKSILGSIFRNSSTSNSAHTTDITDTTSDEFRNVIDLHAQADDETSNQNKLKIEGQSNNEDDGHLLPGTSSADSNGAACSFEKSVVEIDEDKRLKNYKQSEFRRYWMPDSTGRECYECREKFNALRRRHHCRLCGQIFCGRCSNRQVNGAELGYSGVLRLCNYCANQVEGHVKEKRNENHNEQNFTSTFECHKNKLEFDICSSFMENILRKAEGELEENTPIHNLNNKQYEISTQCPKNQISSDKKNDTLLQLFEINLEKLLDDILARENLDATVWRNILLKLSKTVVDMAIEQVLRITNALNFLDFIHIKKISSSSEPYFELIRGVVFTKTLAHRSMSRHAENVSLMLLTGSIAYERTVEKLSSLEQIFLQEKAYLKTQVERVTSRRVSLLLVEHSVSQTAFDMLMSAGVGLVTNVKRRVLQRISRATNADMIASLDSQFLQPRVGFAPDFTQREFILLDGSKKNVLILNHCSADFSILLYGRSLEELVVAKRILKFLLLLRYSTHLEVEFLQMFNSVPGSSLNTTTPTELKKNASHLEMKDFLSPERRNFDKRYFDCELCDLNKRSEDWKDTEPTEFTKLMRNTQLSNSPAIRFVPPFFETSEGRSDPILPYFRQPLYRFFTPEDITNLRQLDVENQEKIQNIQKLYTEKVEDNNRLCHSMLMNCITDPKVLVNKKYWTKLRLQSWFLFLRRHELNQLCKKQREMNLVEKLHNRDFCREKQHKDLLNPYNCQQILFLYCANSKKVTSNARTFCMGPYVLLREFFHGQEAGHKDTNLGVFLMNYCFNGDYKCSTCERSMTEHLRRIVHRNARIEISTHCLPKGNSNVTSGMSTTSITMQDDLNIDGLAPSIIPNMNCSSIICWRRCPKCATNSNTVLLPDAVFHLSFAKFIDYLANGDYWISLFPADTISQTCQHCTFHEHFHYFAYHNFIAVFRVYVIRPLRVTFNPMTCRIDAKDVLCSDLIEAHYNLNSTASDAFDCAVSFFKDYQQSKTCHLSTAAKSLLTFVEQFKWKFRDHLGKFDPDGIFKRNKIINSNDPYYKQSEASLTRCQYFFYAFLTKWNSSKLDAIFITPPCVLSICTDSQSLKADLYKPTNPTTDPIAADLTTSRDCDGAANSSAENNAEERDFTECNTMSKENSTDVTNFPMELPQIHGNLPKNVHFELPMNDSANQIRDLVDGKCLTPDIGSIIAYALSSDDYREKKKQQLIENTDTSDNAHWEFTFGNESKSKYSVKIYFAEKFETLRKTLIGDDHTIFTHSLSHSTMWHPQGGKSGANFFRTEDERFVIKQMLRLEVESFKKFGPSYFDYVDEAFYGRKLTSLCKIYGVFGINITGKMQSNLKMDVLVMEYLFYNKNVKQVWDLKGSLRNRYVSAKTESTVLLDENLVQDLWGNQLYVHHYSKIALNQAIINDSNFLRDQGIMDYSLLAGVCQDEVIIGIVDYVRTFTLDKKVESLVKNALPMTHTPTVLSPELYCKRFYEAIDGYFAIAPDQWTTTQVPDLDALLQSTAK